MREWCKEIPLHLEVILESERAPERLHVCLWVSTVSAYCICWKELISHPAWNWLKSKANPLQTCWNSPGNVFFFFFFFLLQSNAPLTTTSRSSSSRCTYCRDAFLGPTGGRSNPRMLYEVWSRRKRGRSVCVCVVERIWQKGRAEDVRGVRLCCSICAGFIKCRTGLVR